VTVESATVISDLNAALPAVGDDVAEGDDHIKLLKSTIKATFPNINAAVTPTDEELNYVDGVTSAIQTQIDAKAATTALALIPQNSQSADYTLALSDAGKNVFHPTADATPRTFTIPANASIAFPVDTVILITNHSGAGVITIAITTDTLRLAGPGTTGSRTLAANAQAKLHKISATEWLISGTLGLT
jgi:hypothetical protein